MYLARASQTCMDSVVRIMCAESTLKRFSVETASVARKDR